MDLSPFSPEVAAFRRALERLGVAEAPLAVAVSGGPDSLALLLLAAAARPHRLAAATVDHRLRPESAAEAEDVAALCARLGIPHRTLRATVDTGSASLQKAAREARYRVLADWLAATGIAHLATAHHADDQAETMLMRLLRGAGVGGLAGVRPRAILPGSEGQAWLVRPLLSWRRADLAALVRQAGLVAADDPSNRNERFDRVRIRRRLAETTWLDAEPIGRSAAALAMADEALAWTAGRLAAERLRKDGESLRLDPAGLPRELLRRLVLRAVADLVPDATPRGDAVERLIDSLESGGTATLAGVKASGGALWHFRRAPARARRG